MTKTARRAPAAWVRWTLAVLLVLLASVWFGVTTAAANLSLGPHHARYEVTTSGVIVADLGPLGTMRVDSPVRPIGVDVTIQEIPADLAQIDPSTTLEGLSADLQSYLQFFSTPEVTVREVVQALVVDAARRAGLALGVLVLAGVGLWFLVGAPRRRELTARVAPHTWEITAGVLVLALVVGTLAADDRGTRPNVPTSPVFAGTALEGARLTGRLAGVIDTYGTQLLDIYRDNERFYAQARTSLQVAWDRQATIDGLLADVAASRDTSGVPERGGPTPSGEPDAADAPTADAASPQADDADASPAPASTAEETAEVAETERTPGEDLVTFLVVSDLHCNMNMAPLIGDVARNAGVAAILDAGDTTMNGTAVERVCVDSFASARPEGAEMIVSDGNHDSQLIADAQRAQGMTVLDGSVVEVAGVRILGDRDPNETRVGAGTTSRGETLTEMGERLAETACEEDIDLLLVHTPAVGDAALESGCAPLQVSGHTHLRHDPFVRGLGLRYVSGSTAGAQSGQPTVGPLHGTAEMTLLRFDPVARRFVDWKLVEVFPDATAQVSRWQPMPLAPERADDAEDGDDADGGEPGEPEQGPDGVEGTQDPASTDSEPTDPGTTDPAVVDPATSGDSPTDAPPADDPAGSSQP